MAAFSRNESVRVGCHWEAGARMNERFSQVGLCLVRRGMFVRTTPRAEFLVDPTTAYFEQPGLSNRRMWANVTGDGICMDAEGAVWCSDVGPDEGSVCLRVREGGEVLHRIELDRPCYACMLGGEDGRTLFMVVARWFGPDRIDELQRARTGQVLAARVAVPHAGWP